MYPDGLNARATDDEMNISFRPSPNYAALAEAATGGCGSDANRTTNDWMEGTRVATVGQLRDALSKATQRVQKAGTGMLIEALIP